MTAPMEKGNNELLLAGLVRATYELADKQHKSTTQIISALMSLNVVLIDQLAKSGAVDKTKVAEAFLERLETTPEDLRGVVYDVVLRTIVASLTGGRITPDLSEIPEWLRAKLELPKD